MITVFCLFPLIAGAASVRIDGERIWLEAKGESLSTILGMFQERGVEVLLDPAIGHKPISGSWQNTKAGRLLDEMISPYSYVLESKKISGPLGDLYQLSGIRIFADGKKGAAIPLSANRKTLDVFHPDDGSQPYIRDELLVGFGDGTDLDDLKLLLSKMGGTVVDVIKPPGIYRIKLDGNLSVEEATELALAQDGVAAAEPNYAYEPIKPLHSSPGGGSKNANLHLQPGETAVAVFDSGLDPQYQNLPFIRGTYNAINPNEPMSDPNGHGTLMAMLASGAVTPEGASPSTSGVPILAVRTFDENGYTSSEVLMNALNFARNSGVKIINMSWGSETDSQFIRSAMNYASQNGITLVAAAGNEPTGRPVYPSAYPNVICVGGINPDGTPWAQSNYGSFVDNSSYVYAVFNGQRSAGTSISSSHLSHQLAEQQ